MIRDEILKFLNKISILKQFAIADCLVPTRLLGFDERRSRLDTDDLGNIAIYQYQ
ncbi:hypothetical protein H6F44_15100 [Pseudanabaena sp. FACHB-1277]|uniref:Uncharacterized protein n=1 Tax=Pseudanabaena cinerea FACHB-1277 TaxID=2949581 RepID=A0A926UVC1_9CYAN|nr:hypothetical protein [Pseudanabaena cinerea]MBD2151438.1 hypothetical protein [Pseudanabaena cinerea FACHB-1277]